MTKRHNTKYKIDRRLGVNLWRRPKSPFNRRNSKPGQHGVQGKRKKLFGESESGNPIVKMNGNLVQVPIEHTNYETEEWISNSLYNS